MAELNTGGGGGKGKKVRSKKSNPGVDLTAMVDLAFLLITFFILTTTLSKGKSMPLNLPSKDIIEPGEQPVIPGWRTMTILIGKNDKMVSYLGRPGNFAENGEPKLQSYGGKGIRKVILDTKAFVSQRVSDPEKEQLNVIIKSSKSAVYKNLVDILDEMSITKIRFYSLADITDEDLKILQDKGIK